MSSSAPTRATQVGIVCNRLAWEDRLDPDGSTGAEAEPAFLLVGDFNYDPETAPEEQLLPAGWTDAWVAVHGTVEAGRESDGGSWSLDEYDPRRGHTMGFNYPEGAHVLFP